MHQKTHGNLIALEVALEAIRKLRPLIERIRKHDRDLESQLKRAANSVVLNLGEAAYNNAGHRRSRFESARGSAGECRVALAAACAWGYISEAEAQEVDALYDRVLAMTYPLWARA